MSRKNSLSFESLEGRLLLASDGWDGSGLGNASLTYYIGIVPEEIDEAEFREAIDFALAAWTDVVDIQIQETRFARQLDSIDINFGTIDGPNGILAQACLPDDVNPARIAGDILFDAEENWEFGNDQGYSAIDLVIVAVHEIGHSLGLEHVDDPSSIMYESVSPNDSFSELGPSDIDAILELYAARPITIPGDFDHDGVLTAGDVDLLFEQIGSATDDTQFDLNADDIVDDLDGDVTIEDSLATVYGDANLDGMVDAEDLNQVGSNWQSRDGVGWLDGDFTGDGVVDAADLNMVGQSWQFDTVGATASVARITQPRAEVQAVSIDVAIERLQTEVSSARPTAFVNTRYASPSLCQCGLSTTTHFRASATRIGE